MNQHKLSIVIPTYNGGNRFIQLLTQIRQQIRFSNSEIIVIDSSSDDGTAQQATEFGATVFSIKMSDFNHGLTRNYGIDQSHGQFIALFTQDALLLNNTYLGTLMDSIQEDNVAGVFARQIPLKNASPLVRRDVQNWIAGKNEKRTVTIESMNQFFTLSPLQQYYTCLFDNVASIIRRDVWEKIPFSCVPFGEDIEWAYRALLNGYSIKFEPDAVVEHSHERPPSYLYKRTYIDHQRLYELFQLRTIPTRIKAWQSFISTSWKDWSFLLQSVSFSRQWFDSYFSVPFHAWASAWGQYHGARDAAKGHRVSSLKGV